jgi:predicted aminopeptidase
MDLFAAAPALPLDEAGKYVAAAYGVFVTMLVVYIAIIGARFARVEREVKALADLTEDRDQ